MSTLKQIPAAAATKVDQAIKFRFHLVFVGAVLTVSFLYGLAAGLRTPAAAVAAPARFSAASEKRSTLRSLLAQGVVIGEVGENLTVNGHDTDMFSFVSDRNVSELLSEQVARWEKEGFYAGGMVADKRGSAFAIDPATGMRFSFTAWQVPEANRRAVSDGYPVQGVAGELAAPDLKSNTKRIETIPGIPQPFGVKIGSIVRSDDPEGRSTTGTYTSPGSIDNCMRFYSDSLSRQGWTRKDSNSGEITGYQKFEKSGAVVSLLFAETPRDGSSEIETVVTAIRIDSERTSRAAMRLENERSENEF